MASSSKYTIMDLCNLKGEKTVCLTVDVEQDHGGMLEEPSYEGIEHIPDLVSFFKERGIPLTCFIQGSLLETHPNAIKQLFALDTEFELHSYSHPRPREMDVKCEIDKGKEAYRKFFGKDPVGYRAPFGIIHQEDYEILASNGFGFDSSIFPSLRPGIFNNLRKPTKPYLVNNLRIVEFPVAVFSDVVRIPIALSYIKLLGKPYLYFLKRLSLLNLIVFVFHLHDLFELNSSKRLSLERSSFINRRIFRRIYQGRKGGLIILGEVVDLLQKRNYTFSKLIDVYQAISQEKLRA